MCKPTTRTMALRRGVLIFILLAPLALNACRATSFGVGLGIPFTPIGVGLGFPLDTETTIYRPLAVMSEPAGAELYINGALLGSTPMTAAVPFGRGFWGQPRGTVNLLLKKQGYLPKGMPLYPVAGGRIATTPGGPAIDRLDVQLAPGG